MIVYNMEHFSHNSWKNEVSVLTLFNLLIQQSYVKIKREFLMFIHFLKIRMINKKLFFYE